MIENEVKGIVRAPSTDINSNLHDLYFSTKIDWTNLKISLNKIISIAVDLDFPQDDIENLIKSGDIIDNIRDEFEVTSNHFPSVNQHGG